MHLHVFKTVEMDASRGRQHFSSLGSEGHGLLAKAGKWERISAQLW
jgi:hypothetical protein